MSTRVSCPNLTADWVPFVNSGDRCRLTQIAPNRSTEGAAQEVAAWLGGAGIPQVMTGPTGWRARPASNTTRIAQCRPKVIQLTSTTSSSARPGRLGGRVHFGTDVATVAASGGPAFRRDQRRLRPARRCVGAQSSPRRSGDRATCSGGSAARAGADRLHLAHTHGKNSPRTIELTANDMRRVLSETEPEPSRFWRGSSRRPGDSSLTRHPQLRRVPPGRGGGESQVGPRRLHEGFEVGPLVRRTRPDW